MSARFPSRSRTDVFQEGIVEIGVVVQHEFHYFQIYFFNALQLDLADVNQVDQHSHWEGWFAAVLKARSAALSYAYFRPKLFLREATTAAQLNKGVAGVNLCFG